MIIFVNERDEIKDVDHTKDSTLIPHEIEFDNPFAGWSTAKICCYKAIVIGGRVSMMTPYVDSRIIEHIEQLGAQAEANTADISDTREGLIENFEQTLANISDIEDCRTALMELYEIILGE